MAGLTMTREYAHAIATDAGNRSMRKGWPRAAWNDDDFNVAVAAFVRCWPLERAYPWATPEQISEMRRQLGYDKPTEGGTDE